MNNRLWILLGKKLAGESSADEIKELQDIQASDTTAAFQIEIIGRWWSQSAEPDADEAENAFQRHLEKMNRKEIIFPNRLED